MLCVLVSIAPITSHLTLTLSPIPNSQPYLCCPDSLLPYPSLSAIPRLQALFPQSLLSLLTFFSHCHFSLTMSAIPRLKVLLP